MAYAEVIELDLYTGNEDPNSSTEAVALRQVFLDSASQVIDDYLGYCADEKTYTERYDGFGSNFILLNAKPITEIKSISINDEAISVTDFITEDEVLYRIGAMFPAGSKNIEIEYKAGFATIPPAIKLTCLRIAALMYQEMNGNIGITSKSGPGDIGSRTFINYTSYSKYLSALDGFRIVRL